MRQEGGRQARRYSSRGRGTDAGGWGSKFNIRMDNELPA